MQIIFNGLIFRYLQNNKLKELFIVITINNINK